MTKQIVKKTIDNKSKQLTYDSDAEYIFKKGNYTNTYIVVKTNGLPSGVILNLLDENYNQLYSPFDVNGNEIKTRCSVVVGETDAIPLPANYSNNSYTDFNEGTYNWFFKYDGNDYYTEKIIPHTVKICDFKIWDILTPEIYPNEDIKVKVKTYVNTYYDTVDTDLLTPNASYDNQTGIITYPNSDIDDLTIGSHTQTLNQLKNYKIDYTVKNPIHCINRIINNDNVTNTEYNASGDILIGAKISDGCSLNIQQINVTINAQSNTMTGSNSRSLLQRYNANTFPPGTYTCNVQSLLTDNKTYSCEQPFTVNTDNCLITLSFDESNKLTATYLHNNDGIRNAKLTLINLNTNRVMSTKVTNNDGQVTFTANNMGYYKIVAIDTYTGEILLESNIIDTGVITDITLNNDGDLITTKTHRSEMINNEVYIDAYMDMESYDLQLEVSTIDDEENFNDIMVSVDIDSDNIYFTQIKDEIYND